MSALDADVESGLARMVAIEPRLVVVANTLRDLALDDTVSPRVYENVCEAIFCVLNLWSEAQP